MKEYKFDNIQLLNMDGKSREDFSGNYTSEQLADFLIVRWIPNFECHKCGKHDYCKFAEPHPYNEYKKKDIQCGVAREALTNYITYTLKFNDDFILSNPQEFLDSAFYFFNFVYNTEIQIGNYINKDYLNWACYAAPRFLNYICESRLILDNLAISLKKYPNVYEGTPLLLVEGESEMDFVQELISSGFYYSNICCISYHGKSNIKPDKIQMMMEDYQRRNFRVFIQRDADGNNNNMFQQLKEKFKISEENCFQFQFDFESSILPEILYDVLFGFGFLKNISFDEFNKKLSKPVSKCLKENFGIEIEPNKRQIAKQVAKIINNSNWYESEKCKGSELFRFTEFVRGI
jgi:hypothetical protein